MSHPLLDRLHNEFNYPLLTADSLDKFTQQNTLTVLFFTGDPIRQKETADVAVVLPEIIGEFPQLSAAVIDRDSELELQKKYNFLVWPALVFLREGEFLGSITKIRDWSEYLDEIPKILSRTPQPIAS